MLKSRFASAIISLCLLVSIASAAAFADDKSSTAAPPKGQRVMICGHSFHVFVGKMIEAVAKAGGVEDHVNLGTQSIGGSTVTQHWDLKGDKAIVKPALAEGKIDVLTLAPHMKLVPDPAIEEFAKLAFEHNPNIHILVQESWMIFDDFKNHIKDNSERDSKTVEQLKASLVDFKAGLEKQANEINAKLGKKVVYVVPVGDAVLALRAKVIAGEAPGIQKQSELFSDPIGHVKAPAQQLEAYCYYVAIYHKNPTGLTVFEKPGDENSHKLNQLLQEIAWTTVSSDPMSGYSASGK